jgi:hypothetical protein
MWVFFILVGTCGCFALLYIYKFTSSPQFFYYTMTRREREREDALFDGDEIEPGNILIMIIVSDKFMLIITAIIHA